ncbi:MAG: 3-phosphoshikimate 1-carboxyvinyltransferase [Nitrospinae bacterium]|nr:3-phosphoshikimate 1-carboxyvinyltransferase [Nitrospinota bacterium]
MIEIKTVQNLNSSVTVPASKSYTNRALIIAALAEGESFIENPLKSDDTFYMAGALREFGVEVEEDKDFFRVSGSGGKIFAPTKEIHVGNAGTAMRFLATFAALAQGKTVLTGDQRMRERPIGDLLEGLSSIGIQARSLAGNNCPPIEITGGPPTEGLIKLRGGLSSQYLSSLLLSLPAFGKEFTIEIEGKLTSASYIDLTLDIMAGFGVSVERKGTSSFFIKGGQRYRAGRYRVPGDASSASYFFAAAAVTGGRVTVHGIQPDTPQGDIQFLSLLRQMGCEVENGEDSITVTGGRLKGVQADMNLMPDAVQTAAVTAIFAEGETRITNVGNLRIKETDRLAALSRELKKLGAGVGEGADWLAVRPGSYHGARIETYNDHRMAMSFAVAGLKIPGVIIEDPDCVKKSFPNFFEVWEKMSGKDAQ